jgi:hypothetical protein
MKQLGSLYIDGVADLKCMSQMNVFQWWGTLRYIS